MVRFHKDAEKASRGCMKRKSVIKLAEEQDIPTFDNKVDIKATDKIIWVKAEVKDYESGKV